METKHITIHYADLSTKGKNRMMFINKLADHIRHRTRHLDGVKVVAEHSFSYLSWQGASYEEVIDILKDIPGIARFEPSYPVEKEMEAIADQALALFVDLHIQEGDSFRVKAQRSDKQFEHDTYSIQREIGAVVGRAYPQLKVNLDNPDYTLVVAIHHEAAYLSLDSYLGQGGLPYGASEKGMLMLSGGFDSPIAGYLMMRRGMALEVVHFSSPPYTSPQALDKAKKLTAKLAHYGYPMTFHNVPFAEIQEAIRDSVPDSESMTLMRRFMLRIMEALLNQRGAKAIVNGESLGQVASQTLSSMEAINAVTNRPILRPLIAADKQMIIELAQEIGTYDISNEPYEDCCTVFAPKRPSTKPRLGSVEEMEAGMDVEGLVQRALEGIETEVIDESYLTKADQAFSHLL